MSLKNSKRLEVEGIGYILLLAVTLVLTNVLVNYSFECFGYSIWVSVFIYPLVFFFANMITKKYGPINTLFGIIGAVIMQLLIFTGFALSTDINVDLLIVLGTLISFIIMQLVNLELYLKILNGKSSFLKLWILYTALILGDSLLFSLIVNQGLTSDFGMIFLISNVIRVLVGTILVFLDQRQSK